MPRGKKNLTLDEQLTKISTEIENMEISLKEMKKSQKSNNGNYDCCRLPYGSNINRCKIVDKAQDAAYKGTPIIGIFQEQFYPIHDFRFIKYK